MSKKQQWHEAFIKFKEVLENSIIDIEHIGSTGLSTTMDKDIIGVQIVITSFKHIDEMKSL